MSSQPERFSHQEFASSISNSVDPNTAFIERVKTETADSLAVNHPYLDAISKGRFACTELVIKDFAYQYGQYSAHFVRYVSAVIKNLSDENHKAILIHNLEEELGNAHDVDLPEELLATIVDQPHTLLFKRFQEAVGLDDGYPNTSPPGNLGEIWAKEFLELCESNQYVGVGAIGMGTECIVSSIYQQILQGIKAHTRLTPQEYVFFELHSECDDVHAGQILHIARDLLIDEGASEQIEYGVKQALALRTSFWDAMYERAKLLTSLADPIEA